MMLSEAIDKYILWHKSMYHTPSTIESYRCFLGMFLKWCGDIPVTDVSLSLIEEYRLSLVTRSLSSATVATYLRHIKAFFNYLNDFILDDDKLPSDKIKLPRTPKKVLKIYTPSEIDTIFRSVPGTGWIVLRNRFIIALMLDSGLRQHELTLIKKADFSEDGKMLLVHGKGNKERYVPVGNMTSVLHNRYLHVLPYSSEYLLLNRCGDNLTNNAIKLLMSDVRHRAGFEVSSHKLRHNFATNYIINQYQKEKSCDIFRLMYLMGHEDIQTTKRYLHFANQLIASQSYISHLDNLSFMTGVCDLDIKKDLEAL